jgi:aryl-alcohol dehydrogenase-like predicted oxidoreductase
LYQIHWRFSDEPFMDNRGEIVPGVATFGEACGEMQRLKEEGKIRAIGVSNFGETDLGSWLLHGECVSDQLGYNLLFRAPEYEVIPACRRSGVGVLAYMPLMQGLLAGRYERVEDIPPPRRRSRHFSRDREGTRHGERGCEDLLLYTLHELQGFAEQLGRPLAQVAIAWLMAQPGVTSVIVGARKVAHVASAVEAAGLVLGPAEIARLNEITAPLKRRLGRNADMWQNAIDSRVR